MKIYDKVNKNKIFTRAIPKFTLLVHIFLCTLRNISILFYNLNVRTFSITIQFHSTFDSTITRRHKHKISIKIPKNL